MREVRELVRSGSCVEVSSQQRERRSRLDARFRDRLPRLFLLQVRGEQISDAVRQKGRMYILRRSFRSSDILLLASLDHGRHVKGSGVALVPREHGESIYIDPTSKGVSYPGGTQRKQEPKLVTVSSPCERLESSSSSITDL